MDFHEHNNILKNIKKTEIVAGNCTNTVPEYFKENKESVIALAYFDMGLYEPTLSELKIIKKHLISGSVIMLEKFNNNQMPGETLAFREVFQDVNCSFMKSQFFNDRTIVTI